MILLGFPSVTAISKFVKYISRNVRSSTMESEAIRLVS